ncbi:putative HMP/thiamine import ATP-binding protein YkoD [Desulfosporosinus acididurans]|uniref:Putative HMP/thiamine import ATP-binding protein YkoD n=1 Tax=Desulfosporosinus acididurans TaxID=476652 RepID=A0A0J1FJJ0_9FIRM|nr:ABC transporter ATP-binding protein [Desulfosporosinus acididurans]KLU63639.1 putative HMP/thiamine import ATP-binding protein YkoD [Desulfosporosinus acididurans]
MKVIAKIIIEKLKFPNNEKPVLKNINFEIKQGDFIVITGGVASGKSALLHVITGAIPHYHNAELTGTVIIMGQDIKDMPLNRMSDYMGYMMQEPDNQIISLNVYENVAFGLENQELPYEQINQVVKNTLEFVGLRGYEERQTSSLSGGQAQRVVLAGVLALKVPILILDQPTAELDPQGRQEIYKRLGELNNTQNLTIIMVMDRVEEVLNYANRVLMLKDGEISKDYSPREYYWAQIKYQKELFRDSRHYTLDSNKPRESIAKISNVSFLYNNQLPGCEDINLEVYKGDFLSVVGLNGSGKSTLAKLLIGLLKPAMGEIRLFDQIIAKRNLSKILARVGFLFQNPDHQIFASTVEEEVGFSLKLRGERNDNLNQKVDQCLQFVGLADYKEMHPQRLSRGQRQLLALASILAGDPEFIITDEPTSGLDENQGYMIMEKLYDLSNNGKTILLITHDLAMAKDYSNRLVALYKHRIRLDIETKDIERHREELKAIGLDFPNTVTFKEGYDDTGTSEV